MSDSDHLDIGNLGTWATLVLSLVLTVACGDRQVAPSLGGTAELDTLMTVSFRGLPTPRPSSPVAVRADLGRVAVALGDGSGEILLFDGQGELVQQIGRAGEGPGEFREISLLEFHPASDSLWVLDWGNSRISVVAPDDAETSRDMPLQGRFFGAAWASDTLLVVQGQFRDNLPENALGRAVYDGDVMPILVEDGVTRLDSFDAFIRPVTSSASGGLWVGHFRRPELRRFDSTLETMATLEYHAPFLGAIPENAEPWAEFIDTEPAVLDLTEDASGALWVLFGVPADPLPSVNNPQRALAEGRVDASDLSRTVLTRYDPEALARGPLDEFEQGPLRGGLLPGGVAYYFDADALGEAMLTLVRLGS